MNWLSQGSARERGRGRRRRRATACWQRMLKYFSSFIFRHLSRQNEVSCGVNVARMGMKMG